MQNTGWALSLPFCVVLTRKVDCDVGYRVAKLVKITLKLALAPSSHASYRGGGEIKILNHKEKRNPKKPRALEPSTCPLPPPSILIAARNPITRDLTDRMEETFSTEVFVAELSRHVL